MLADRLLSGWNGASSAGGPRGTGGAGCPLGRFRKVWVVATKRAECALVISSVGRRQASRKRGAAGKLVHRPDAVQRIALVIGKGDHAIQVADVAVFARHEHRGKENVVARIVLAFPEHSAFIRNRRSNSVGVLPRSSRAMAR